MAVGIVSFGTYIPRYRLSSSHIDTAWNRPIALPPHNKSVPGIDEDAVTISVEAAKIALDIGHINPAQIQAILIGSESHPYVVKPSSTIVGELLGVGNNYLAADLEFACKAGSAGMQLLAGLVFSKKIQLGLAIGADTAQGKPRDALEYTSAAAGAAFLMGNNPAVSLLDYCSYSSDTPDFWRRDGSVYPSHAGRFTGEPAYFTHITGAANLLLKKSQIKPADVDYCVFHMPNSKFPRDIAAKLGFKKDQLAASLVVDTIGNPYSASSLLGLAQVLKIVRPGQKIFMVSYGSGAGSDAFLWQATSKITPLQKNYPQKAPPAMDIDYLTYLKFTKKI